MNSNKSILEKTRDTLISNSYLSPIHIYFPFIVKASFTTGSRFNVRLLYKAPIYFYFVTPNPFTLALVLFPSLDITSLAPGAFSPVALRYLIRTTKIDFHERKLRPQQHKGTPQTDALVRVCSHADMFVFGTEVRQAKY